MAGSGRPGEESLGTVDLRVAQRQPVVRRQLLSQRRRELRPCASNLFDLGVGVHSAVDAAVHDAILGRARALLVQQRILQSLRASLLQQVRKKTKMILAERVTITAT